jgi:hypothetical protein
MQTFLPFADFQRSARVLDYRRLGKQRVEATQILNALDRGGGWANHPAVRMWRGFEPALRRYRNVMVQEWVRRGYNNSMVLYRSGGRVRIPEWVGDESFHAAHRANLLRKDPTFYGQYGWSESSTLPYVWPV